MEAIKTAVACNLGVAFVSRLAVEKEVAAGELHALTVQGIPLTRSLRCVANPARYQSRAVRAFIDLMFDPSACSPADVPTPLKEQVCHPRQMAESPVRYSPLLFPLPWYSRPFSHGRLSR